LPDQLPVTERLLEAEAAGALPDPTSCEETPRSSRLGFAAPLLSDESLAALFVKVDLFLDPLALPVTELAVPPPICLAAPPGANESPAAPFVALGFFLTPLVVVPPPDASSSSSVCLDALLVTEDAPAELSAPRTLLRSPWVLD
jgi:hypothetical protein